MMWILAIMMSTRDARHMQTAAAEEAKQMVSMLNMFAQEAGFERCALRQCMQQRPPGCVSESQAARLSLAAMGAVVIHTYGSVGPERHRLGVVGEATYCRRPRYDTPVASCGGCRDSMQTPAEEGGRALTSKAASSH